MHGAVPELRNISAPDTVMHWMVSMLHNLHVTSIKVGVCTPAACGPEDLQKLIQLIPEKIGLEWKINVRGCETLEEVTFTGPQVAVLCVMGILVLLLAIGTGIDIFKDSIYVADSGLKGAAVDIALTFSVPRNIRRLAEYSCPEKSLSFVNGIVFVVFYWTVIANTFMYVNYDVTANLDKAFRLVQHLFYEVALNRVLPLQVFFFVSGLTTAYRWMKSPEKSPNVFKFLINRYLRYTPGYALVLALMILVPTWGSGPSWSSHITPMYENCHKNLYLNLFYINNFFDSAKVCLDHTWVFAVDAQLHLLSIVILVPLKLRPKIGILVATMLAVASVASVALTNVYYDLPPNELLAFLHEKDRNYYAEHSYYRVYSQLGLYCTGILVGYTLYKKPDLKVSKKLCFFLWAGTGAGFLAALCTVNEWRSGVVPSPLVAALYSSLSKVSQAAFLAWFSIACFTGNSGFLRDMLSWRPFAFFGRLSFLAYTLHVPIINIAMGLKKSHVFVSDFELFYIVLNHVAGTFVVAYVLFVCFEAPWLAMADLVRRRSSPPTPLLEKPPKSEKPVNSSHC